MTAAAGRFDAQSLTGFQRARGLACDRPPIDRIASRSARLAAGRAARAVARRSAISE